MDITVTVRDSDVGTLTELANVQWRNVEQQASALLEQALQTARAKSEPRMPRGTRTRRNGTTTLVGAAV